MIFIIPIFLLFGTYLLSHYNTIALPNKKISPGFFSPFVFGLMQFINTLILFLFNNITYSFFSVFSIVLFFLLFLGFCSFFIYKIFNYHHKHQLFKQKTIENYKENWIYFLAIIVFSIIIIFTSNQFSDTGYYLELSNYFKIKNNSLPVFNNEYRYASSYYVYSAFSLVYQNSIPAFFNFLTPFIFFIVIGSYFNEMVKLKINDLKKLWCTQSLLYVALVLLMVFLNPFVISGNLVIQSSLVIILLLILINKRYDEIPFLFLFVQFFSITGLLLSIILFIAILIYYFIFKGIRFLLNKSTYLFMSMSISGIVFPILFNSISYKISLILFILLFLFFIALTSALILFNIKASKKEINNKFVNFQFKNEVFMNKKFMIINILVASLCTLITIIYFTVSYKQHAIYDHNMTMIISSILLFPMILFMLFNKKQNNQYLFLLIISSIIVTLAVIFMWLINWSNGSIWRIASTSYYLTFDGLNPILGIFIITAFILDLLKYEKIKTFFSNQKLLSNKRIWYNILLFLNTTIFSLILIITNLCNFPNAVEYSIFKPNVVTNLNLFKNDDLKLLNEINNNNWSYASDNMASMYLITENKSLEFIKNIYGNDLDKRSWAINRADFYHAQIFGNVTLSLQSFETKLDNAILNMPSDCLIIAKNTIYFNYIYNHYQDKIINESSNLIIIKN